MRVKGSSPAVRVAAVATAAIAVVYVIGAIVLNLVVARHMTQQDDDQLGDRLTIARHHPDTLRQRVVPRRREQRPRRGAPPRCSSGR